MTHHANAMGSLIGAMSSVFGMVSNMIPAQSIMDAVIIAMIGATAGFFTNMALRRIFYRKRKFRK